MYHPRPQWSAAGEDCLQPAVAAVGRGEGETLLRRVDAVHLRAYADHVEEGVFLQEQSALQSGMDSQDLWFSAEEVGVGLACDVQQRGMDVGRPSRVSVAVGYLVARHRQRVLHLAFNPVLRRLDG